MQKDEHRMSQPDLVTVREHTARDRQPVNECSVAAGSVLDTEQSVLPADRTLLAGYGTVFNLDLVEAGPADGQFFA